MTIKKRLTVKEAVVKIKQVTGTNISERQVRHEILVKKRIQAEKVGYTYLIDPEELEKYQRAKRGPKPKNKL